MRLTPRHLPEPGTPRRPLAGPVSKFTLLAVALSAAIFVLGIRLGSHTAGGSDSYGYVSQADLWLHGNLRVEQPWTVPFAWPSADWAFTPLAYRPGPVPHTIVPAYPPGLPLLMAAFRGAAGKGGEFLVVPVMGAFAVWMTWLLGRKALGDGAGLLAALLLATSPAFLFQVLQPMSDVPATAVWLAAMLLVVGPPPRPVFAGLVASLAILIRPNLSPLAAVLAGALLLTNGAGKGKTENVHRAALFTTALLPGFAVYAAFNAALYGAPLRSGYGTFGEILTLADPGGTLLHYAHLVVQTQTLFVALAPIGLVALLWRRDGSARTVADTRGLLILLAGSIVVVFGLYAFYTRFEEWTYLRFLLPAYPAILLLAVGGLEWISGAARRPKGSTVAPRAFTLRSLLVIAVCVVVAGLTWRKAVGLGVFGIARVESRYERVAESVARLTPPNAAVLSMQHSGSLRLYASRPTVRYDMLEPGSLDAVVRDLVRAGYRPYILLEDWEVQAFRARFGRASPAGELDRSPVARLWPRPAVFLYDAQDAGVSRHPGSPR